MMNKYQEFVPSLKLKTLLSIGLFFLWGRCFSQNNSLYSLDVSASIIAPIGDFENLAKSGFQTGVALNRNIYKNWVLGIGANYNQFNLRDEFPNPGDEWRSFSFELSPQYLIPLNKFFVQFYGYLGLSMKKSPGIIQYAPFVTAGMNKEDFVVFNKKGESSNAFYTGLGFKIGAKLSNRLNLFLGTSYRRDLKNTISYKSRDLSSAVDPSGRISYEIVYSTPFKKESLAYSGLEFNLGIRINLGKAPTPSEAQDYNSSRSNKPRPMREIYDNPTDSIPEPSEAQDYNSSRSNKPRPIRKIYDNPMDSIPEPSEAQDYNSSRSNKPRPMRKIDGNPTDSIPQPSEAQDYNSSRSNKPRPMRKIYNNPTDSIPQPSEAQDYNSSRSNKPRPMRKIYDNPTDSIPEPSEAQDYNSSRSNKPRPIRKIYDNPMDSIPQPSEAQDYNSSRSNKPRPIRKIDNNSTDSIPQPSEAQDYNSSRSNKPRPMRKIYNNPTDSIPQPSEAQDYNSSRSNKPRPMRKIDNNPTDSIPQPNESQD